MTAKLSSAIQHIEAGEEGLRRTMYGDGKRFQLGRAVNLAKDLASIPHMCVGRLLFALLVFCVACVVEDVRCSVLW